MSRHRSRPLCHADLTSRQLALMTGPTGDRAIPPAGGGTIAIIGDFSWCRLVRSDNMLSTQESSFLFESYMPEHGNYFKRNECRSGLSQYLHLEASKFFASRRLMKAAQGLKYVALTANTTVSKTEPVRRNSAD